jgi:hypothetical protein
MGMLLAFAPFIVFALADRFIGPMQALLAAAAVSAALVARDALTPGRTPKTLEVGALLLFAGLALYAALGGPIGSLFGVKLAVDAGLLLIALVTITIRRPFTLQYARESVARELWDNPEFVRVNYVITGAWTLAFAVIIAADIVLVYVPGLPQRFGVIATVLALIAAYKFTGWYPSHATASIRDDRRAVGS